MQLSDTHFTTCWMNVKKQLEEERDNGRAEAAVSEERG